MEIRKGQTLYTRKENTIYFTFSRIQRRQKVICLPTMPLVITKMLTIRIHMSSAKSSEIKQYTVPSFKRYLKSSSHFLDKQ